MFFFFFVFIFVHCHGTKEDDFHYSENIVVLGEGNINEIFEKYEYVLVKFYAPWCPHCRSLAPEYSLVADHFAESESIAIATLDCDKANDICVEYEIPGFPSVKLFNNGVFWADYDQERSSSAIINWMKRKTGPASVFVESAEAVEKIKEEYPSNSLVLGHFPTQEEKTVAHEQFLKVAKSLDDFVFLHCDEFLFPEFNEKENGILVLRYFDETPLLLPGEYEDAKELEQDILANGYPLVDEISATTFQRFFSSGLPIMVIFMDPADEEHEFQDHLEVLENIAGEFKGKMSFGWSNSAMYSRQYTVMGGKEGDFPGLGVMDLSYQRNFIFEGKPFIGKEEELKAWAEGILDGSIKPFLKSAEIPTKEEDMYDNGVRVVVGKTFEELVMDPSKDTMVVFHAPWCQHCQRLMPTYEELHSFFKGIDTLMIGKIDGSANDCPDPRVQISGFPTIVFYPSEKEGEEAGPIVYEGSRTKDDLIEFVKNNAVVSKEAIEGLLRESSSEPVVEDNTPGDDL